MPGLWQDPNGFMRYPQREHDARVQHIETHGPPVSITVDLWEPFWPWQSFDQSLSVLHLHPGEHFLHLCGNPESAHWGFHLSLCRINELTPSLTQDLIRAIAHIEGWTGTMDIFSVCSTCTHVPSWHCASLGHIWWELTRLRAAGGHPVRMTWSA